MEDLDFVPIHCQDEPKKVGPCGKCHTFDCENCPVNDLDGKIYIAPKG